jgi:hypothetical protein
VSWHFPPPPDRAGVERRAAPDIGTSKKGNTSNKPAITTPKDLAHFSMVSRHLPPLPDQTVVPDMPVPPMSGRPKKEISQKFIKK